MEINKKNTLNFFNEAWKFVKKYSQKIWNILKEWNIVKIIGFVLVALSTMAIFLETIIIGLIHSDKLKFEEIINYYFDIKIFDYISSLNFHLITGGGYLLDIFFWIILLFIGVYWWSNKNYFKKTWSKILLGLLLFLGVISFSIGFYKAMPRIAIPLEKICKKIHFDDECRNKARVKIKRYDNGFDERMYIDDDFKRYILEKHFRVY